MYSFSNTDNIDKSASITNVNLQQDKIKLAGKAFSGFMLFIVCIVIASKILQYIIESIIQSFFHSNISDANIDSYIQAARCIFYIIFIFIFIRRNNIKMHDIFMQKCKLKDIAVIIPLMILMLAICCIWHYIFQPQIDKDAAAQALLASSGGIHGNVYLYFARIVIIIPIIEEIIFRGIMLKGLCSYGHRSACIITSSLFAIMHGSITLFPTYFLLAFAISHITVKIGSIWPAIFAHIINNYAAFLVQLYPSNDVNTDDISIQEIIIIRVLLVFIILSVSLYFKNINKQYKQTAPPEDAQCQSSSIWHFSKYASVGIVITVITVIIVALN